MTPIDITIAGHITDISPNPLIDPKPVMNLTILNLSDDILQKLNISRQFSFPLGIFPRAGVLLIPTDEIVNAIRTMPIDQVRNFINQLPTAPEAIGMRLVHEWFAASPFGNAQSLIILARVIDGAMNANLSQFQIQFLGVPKQSSNNVNVEQQHVGVEVGESALMGEAAGGM